MPWAFTVFPACQQIYYLPQPSTDGENRQGKKRDDNIFCNVAKCNLVEVIHQTMLARGLHY